MRDKVGKEIPKHLETVFKRPGLLMAIEKYNELEASVLRKIDAGDELFNGIHRPTFEAIHRDIRSTIGSQIPYAVCDWCDGAGCDCCKGKGWLGKFMWDATPRKGE